MGMLLASVVSWQKKRDLYHKVLNDRSENLSQKEDPVTTDRAKEGSDDGTDSRSKGKHDSRLQTLGTICRHAAGSPKAVRELEGLPLQCLE